MIQTYYSCVLAPWEAFYEAVGIGAASAGAFVPVLFAIYLLLTYLMLNYCWGANIPSRAMTDRAAEEEAERKEQQFEEMLEKTERMTKLWEALQADLQAPGKGNLLPKLAALSDGNFDSSAPDRSDSLKDVNVIIKGI